MNAGALAEFVRFAIVGVGNTAIGAGTILLLAAAGVAPFLANLAGYGVGTLFSYFANARWTFGTQPRGATLVRFIAVTVACYGVNVAILAFGLSQGWGNVASQVPAIIGFTLLSFAGHRLFTFRKERSQ